MACLQKGVRFSIAFGSWYLLAAVAMLFTAFTGVGCSREYSFEGADTAIVRPLPVPTPDSNNRDDSMNGLKIQSCPNCPSSTVIGYWSMQVAGARLCGKIDTAILSPERDAFTFFGPSECSKDSGLIVTAFLQSEALTASRQQLTTSTTTFYYYDNVAGPYMLQSARFQTFTLTIANYDHETKLAEGSFSGVGLTKDGKLYTITDGRWKTFLK